MAASLTVSLVSAAVYLALDTQRIAAVLRPSLTRAKVAYYLWIAERVFGAAIFAGLVVMSMNDPELQKKIAESSKKQGPTLWRVLLMFTPFILGFALWKMNRNLVSTERREQQQRQLQQQQQQQQQGALAQNSNAAGNQQRQRTRMRRWPAVFEAFCAALSFGSVCYRFAIMSLPVLCKSFVEPDFDSNSISSKTLTVSQFKIWTYLSVCLPCTFKPLDSWPSTAAPSHRFSSILTSSSSRLYWKLPG